MRERQDVISIVEASYALEGSDQAWAQGIADALQAFTRSSCGCVAYGGSLDPVRLDFGAQAGNIYDMIGGLRHAAQDPAYLAAIGMLRLPVDRILLSDMLPPDQLHLGLLPGGREAGMNDGLNVRAHPIDERFLVVIGVGYDETPRLAPAERARWRMLAAHVEAGYRLRQRLRAMGLDQSAEPGSDEAVLDPGGRVAHADGSARSADALEALRGAARAIDKARASAGGRDHDALEAWRALVRGEWSLVDAFDSDGRRYLLARRNQPHARDPRGLTEQEAAVAAYAAQGLSNKLIAYTLGTEPSTVSTQLTAAMRKLGVASRPELASRFDWVPLESLMGEEG
jgi:DNA-binding CsgD family transcriptional regulator